MNIPQPILTQSEREWSDWISPILVKELRQGVRETSFIVSFLALQFALAFLALASLSSEQQAERNKLLFEYSLFGVFFGVLPLWNAFSLSHEIRQNTLETMLMTRMSAWWLVFGKWIARTFQSFLIASTVLPFFILQYLNGKEELVSDLYFMTYLVFGNLVLSAVGLGISVISNGFVKFASLCGVGFFLFAFISFYLRFSEISAGRSVFGIILAISVCFSAIVLILDLTAAEINPEINNNPFYRRIFSLIVIGCVLIVLGINYHHLSYTRSLYVVFSDISTMVRTELLLFATIVAFIEISRPPVITKKIMLPYVKWGNWGRRALLFFLPGWPSAFLFCLPAVIVIFLCSKLGLHSISSATIFAFLGSILIPLICNTVGLTRFASPGFVMIGFNCLSITFVSGISRPLRDSPYPDGSLPFVPCFATMSSMTDFNALVSASISCGLMIFALYGLAIPWLRKVDQIWKEACMEKAGICV